MSQGKCESAPAGRGPLVSWSGLAWDRLIRYRPPPSVYRSESEKEEGLVHLHTSISSPATRWDSVWIRDSLEARNSTARSHTRFMRLLRRGGGEGQEASRPRAAKGAGLWMPSVPKLGAHPEFIYLQEEWSGANRTLAEERNFMSPEKSFLNHLCSKSFQLKGAERGCSPPTPGVQVGRLLLGLDTAAGPLPASSAGCILMSRVG